MPHFIAAILSSTATTLEAEPPDSAPAFHMDAAAPINLDLDAIDLRQNVGGQLRPIRPLC
ncbi:MAG: hypothetical protein R3F11_32960 [Verrucomicrobiales bacterium]